MSFTSMIEEAGAKFDGIQKIKGKDKYALATDLQTGSTYYLPIEGLSKKKVQSKLVEERKKKINIRPGVRPRVGIDTPETRG